MPLFPRIALTAALAFAAGPALAQVSYGPAAGANGVRGQYGGGFIELLMTGRSGSAQPPMTGPAAAPAGYGGGYGYGAPAEAPARISRELDPSWQRQEVAYGGGAPAGSIVIDTASHFLYHVHGGGSATRYGIGVGRPGFAWSGVKTVTAKREWPDWTPPAEMLRRRPDLPRHMAGGPANPLGARALYLGSSLYRIHGTNEPWTIGQNVSSGCIRMMNEDVADLYSRVGVGTVVRVI